MIKKNITINHFITATILFLAMTILVTADIGDRDAADIKKQIILLQSGTPKQKIDATRTLGQMGRNALPAVPFLIELIDSSEKYETLLDKLYNSINPLGTAGTYVQYEAQQALTMIGRPAVEQLSAALMKHPRTRVRSNAAIVLGNIKDFQSIEPLTESLNTDRNYEVRMWSADALGRFAEIWSIDSLGNAVHGLMTALRDKDSNVRRKAAYSLGKLKAIEAVPSLIEILQVYGKDSDAGLALFMITGQSLGDDPQKWQEWWHKNEHSHL